jgi:hypothetical protein
LENVRVENEAKTKPEVNAATAEERASKVGFSIDSKSSEENGESSEEKLPANSCHGV